MKLVKPSSVSFPRKMGVDTQDSTKKEKNQDFQWLSCNRRRDRGENSEGGMKKKTKETIGKKGEKERRENQRENDGGTPCSAGSAACGSSSRSDCAWCGAKEGSIPGILKHHQCGADARSWTRG